MLALVLGEGGIPGYRPLSRSEPDPESDRAFASLLNELRQTATSPAFATMLEACLDRATEVLLDGLRKNVFGSMDRPRDGMDEIEIPRLASLLPGLARWSHLALNTVPNELVDVRCPHYFRSGKRADHSTEYSRTKRNTLLFSHTLLDVHRQTFLNTIFATCPATNISHAIDILLIRCVMSHYRHCTTVICLMPCLL